MAALTSAIMVVLSIGAGTQAAQASTLKAPQTFTGSFGTQQAGSGAANIKFFNPLTATGGLTWLNLYLEPLVLYNTKLTKIRGVLAQSWGVSPDGKTYTFHLRKGVTWQDGKPFTSKDVAFTLRMVQDPNSDSSESTYFTSIQSVDTPDPSTVVLHLSQPDGGLVSNLAYLYILPEHLLGGMTAAQLAQSSWWYTHPIGTGPYKFTKFVPGQYIELQANNKYWGGKPKIKYMINKYYPNPSSQVIALQKGEIQYASTISTTDASNLKSVPGVKVLSAPYIGAVSLWFNNNDPRIQKLDVRQAIMYAINKPAIVKGILHGGAVVTSCAYPPGPYTPSGLNAYSENQNKARQLLAAADWDKIKGQPLQLITYINDQENDDALVAIQNDLEAVGIDAQVRVLDNATFTSMLASNSFAMALGRDSIGPDPSVIQNFYLSNERPSVKPGGDNLANINMPQLDQLLEKANATTDAGKRTALYQQVCKLTNQQLPLGYLWLPKNYAAVSSTVRNFTWGGPSAAGYYYPDAQDWSISASAG